MIGRRTAHWTVATLVALAMTAGCTSEPADKDGPLPTRPLAEVTQQTKSDAQIVADAAGAKIALWSHTPAPCDGPNGETADDDRWALTASFSLDVAPTDQLAAIGRIKSALEKQCWAISEETNFDGGTRGILSARVPATGQNLNLFTTKNLDSIAVTIASACYMPAPGENPLKD